MMLRMYHAPNRYSTKPSTSRLRKAARIAASHHGAKDSGHYFKAISDGLLHVFRQEVDRDYAASVEGVVIPADWVRSAIDAHVTLGFREYKTDQNIAGLDVADGGGDRNALALRRGVVLRHLVEWGERDTG